MTASGRALSASEFSDRADDGADPSLAQREFPAFTVPASLARVFARLPQLPPTMALVGALNLALGRLLPRENLEPLVGRLVCIRVLDAGLTLDFTLTPTGFRPTSGVHPWDLRISASTRDFIALALRKEDPDALFFDRRLQMEGDTELGLIVKNTLDSVDLSGVLDRLPLDRLRLDRLRPGAFARRPQGARRT